MFRILGTYSDTLTLFIINILEREKVEYAFFDVTSESDKDYFIDNKSKYIPIFEYRDTEKGILDTFDIFFSSINYQEELDIDKRYEEEVLKFIRKHV